ncbi:alpha/beta hydrolase [Zavarzinia sp. CC-PAN008]|uniref:alpha/beta hydrolase n=1 Tax=Zavarzinia sp. CC-PAN008 TaxID=3243332 RepID=UPI003F74A3B1
MLALLAGVLAGAWFGGSMLSAGATWPVAPAVAPAQDITLALPDGLAIAGTWRPGPAPGAPGVLILHGLGSSRGQMRGTADWLASLGYASLAIDFRGHGGSTLAERSFGWHEAQEAHAAFAWLKQRQDGARIAVIGISMGGAAALLGPDGPLPADGLVLQAVYPTLRQAIWNRVAPRLPVLLAGIAEPLLSYQSLLRYGVWPDALSPRDAVRRFPAPVLVIGGADDSFTPPEETRALYDAVPGPRDLWLVPGANHAQASSLATDAYRSRVATFLAQVLRD